MAVKMERENAIARVSSLAEDAAEERILDALLPAPRSPAPESTAGDSSETRQKLRKRLREGTLDDNGNRDRGFRNPGGG